MKSSAAPGLTRLLRAWRESEHDHITAQMRVLVAIERDGRKRISLVRVSGSLGETLFPVVFLCSGAERHVVRLLSYTAKDIGLRKAPFEGGSRGAGIDFSAKALELTKPSLLMVAAMCHESCLPPMGGG